MIYQISSVWFRADPFRWSDVVISFRFLRGILTWWWCPMTSMLEWIVSRQIFCDLNNLHQLPLRINKIKVLMSHSHTDPARNKRTPFDIDKSTEHVFRNRAACRGLFKVLLDWVLSWLCQTWFVKLPKIWNLVLFMWGSSNIKAHACRFRNPEIQYEIFFGVPHWRIRHKHPKTLILLSSEVQCKKWTAR